MTSYAATPSAGVNEMGNIQAGPNETENPKEIRRARNNRIIHVPILYNTRVVP